MAPIVELAALIVAVLALSLVLVLLRNKRGRTQAIAPIPASASPLVPPAPVIPIDGAASDMPEATPDQREGTRAPVVELVSPRGDTLPGDGQLTDVRRQYEEKDIAFEKRGTVVIRPEVEFIQLMPGQLKPVVVVPQALDNQWTTNRLWTDMAANHRSLLDESVRKQREPLVRAEYLRALINADQIVVNRAFIFNNPAVYQDYVSEKHDDDDRKDALAFKAMLEKGDIVPYLLNEQTPVQPPKFHTLQFEAWQNLCRDSRIRCIRLDWDDARNRGEINQWMTRRFHDLALTAHSQDMTKLVQDLGLDPSMAPEVRQRLRELATWCLRVEELKERKGEDPLVTRNEIYGGYDLIRRDDGSDEGAYERGPDYLPGFVVADGTNPALGYYDRDKPFSREIQRLMDLGYNSYLPDAIKGYPLTPTESLPRTALQELEQAARQAETVTGGQLLNLLQNAVFALTQQGLSLPFTGVLHLSDVRDIRHMDEWLLYIQSVEQLLRDPLSFANPDGGARAVYNSYFALAQKIAGLVEKRYEGRARDLLAPWLPRIEFVLDIGLKTLTLHWTPAGVFFSTKLADRVVHGAVSVVGQLVVRGSAQVRVGTDLATSFVFMKRTMLDGQGGWEQLIAGLRRQGIKERAVDIVEEGTMGYREQPSDM